MTKRVSSHHSAAFVGIAALLYAGSVSADPPLPGPTGTVCSTVQCMRVTDVIDVGGGAFDVEFETFNWFDTTTDGGVHKMLFFTTNLVPKTCAGVTQVEVLGATAPSGWTVVRANNDVVEFEADSPASAIPDVGLCDTTVTVDDCFATNTCGNDQGGFVLTLKPNIPTGFLCSWAANWRHLDENGVDNGDVMNFGSVSWTFGSLLEDYSNTPLPPSQFPATDVDTCAKKTRKAVLKYGQVQLKLNAKCRELVAAGKTCDEVAFQTKIDGYWAKAVLKIDEYCTDDRVANVAWCGTTVASLKTCLQTETDDAVAATILALYGP